MKFKILTLCMILTLSLPVSASQLIEQTPDLNQPDIQFNIQENQEEEEEEQDNNFQQESISQEQIQEQEQQELVLSTAKSKSKKTFDPAPASLSINKELISGVWHVACDVMGNKAWVKDQISNPEGIPAKQGHRLAYCGDPYHWIIYLDTYGNPYQMDEIHSGATGGTLNTKFYTDGTYTEQIDISELQVNQRIYWTTENKGQVWHHTGITFP